MEEIHKTEVTSTATSTSTLDGEYIVIPVKAKKEWLQNAFKKKEQTVAQPHLRPDNVLVQDRHRWIQEELQLRTTLKSQGKSDLAITQELVQARKRWLDDERKKYQETVIISPGEHGKFKRFFQEEEKKENDNTPDRDGATVASRTNETKLIVSRDAVEARKRWLNEEAFGNNWQRPNIGVEDASMLSTLSMQTKVGLVAVSEDEVNGLGPISPRDALRLTCVETNTLKTTHTSECDEELEEMLVGSNCPISNKKANDKTIMGDTYDTNASERKNSDKLESPMKSNKTNQNSTTGESDKERVLHAETCEPSEIGKVQSGEQNLGNDFDKAHHYRQQDLMMAPTDERLGLSLNNPRLDEPALRDETPAAVDRDDWKIVQSNSEPVDTPCLEACSIM
jgi:hypothetical protein